MWPTMPFGAVAEVVTGTTPPRKNPDNYGTGVPWVKPPNLDGWEPVTRTSEQLTDKGLRFARLLPKGAVMVCCIGSVGRVGIAGTVLATNQQINSLIFGSSVVPEFGYYYCHYARSVFEGLARTAVVPILNKRAFSEIEMPVPPRPEQRRIVEILNWANALRKKRAEADAKAARILPALFYKMFGDPATNPLGWPIVSGQQIFRKIGYGVGSPPPFSEQGIPFLRAANTKPSGLNRTNLVFFDSKYESSIARSKVEEGDVVIVRRGANTGDAAVITEEFHGAYVGYDLICLPSGETNPWWFVAAWNHPTIRPRIEQIRSRAAQQGLNRQQIAEFELPRPPRALQDNFACSCNEVARSADLRRHSLQSLDLVFHTLMRMSFTGALTANWRESHMKELLAEMEIQARYLEPL